MPDHYLPSPVKKNTARFVMVVLVASMVLAVGVSIAITFRSPTWDPLDLSQIQKVSNRVPGVEGPAAHITEQISVTGTKCNTSQDPLTVIGVTVWVAVVPPGAAENLGQGVANRSPGCVTKTFLNDIPPAVVTRSKFLFGKGAKRVVWQITGFETPIRDSDGKHGLQRTWRAENITLVP